VIRKLIVGLCAAAAILLAAVSFLWALDVAVPGRAHGAEIACHGQEGIASFYSYTGRRTASGELFDGTGMTAAMSSPSHIGERYRVTYRGRSAVVRINDTGGFAKYGRIIDLSRAAAAALGMIPSGVGTVCLDRLG
jgi:rare lipoprotein A (peptidoglycan hydrolase)